MHLQIFKRCRKDISGIMPIMIQRAGSYDLFIILFEFENKMNKVFIMFINLIY